MKSKPLKLSQLNPYQEIVLTSPSMKKLQKQKHNSKMQKLQMSQQRKASYSSKSTNKPRFSEFPRYQIFSNEVYKNQAEKLHRKSTRIPHHFFTFSEKQLPRETIKFSNADKGIEQLQRESQMIIEQEELLLTYKTQQFDQNIDKEFTLLEDEYKKRMQRLKSEILRRKNIFQVETEERISTRIQHLSNTIFSSKKRISIPQINKRLSYFNLDPNPPILIENQSISEFQDDSIMKIEYLTEQNEANIFEERLRSTYAFTGNSSIKRNQQSLRKTHNSPVYKRFKRYQNKQRQRVKYKAIKERLSQNVYLDKVMKSVGTKSAQKRRQMEMAKYDYTSSESSEDQKQKRFNPYKERLSKHKQLRASLMNQMEQLSAQKRKFLKSSFKI